MLMCFNVSIAATCVENVLTTVSYLSFQATALSLVKNLSAKDPSLSVPEGLKAKSNPWIAEGMLQFLFPIPSRMSYHKYHCMHRDLSCLPPVP